MSDSKTLVNQLRQNILFYGINQADFFQAFADRLKTIKKSSGELIYRQGQIADGLYLIVEGKVKIDTERNQERYVISHAQTHHLVGEFLLEGESVRSTNAEVMDDAELLFISVNDFKALQQDYPEAGSLVGSRMVNRLCWNQTNLALRLCRLFVGLDENIVRQIINAIQITSIPSNTLLFKQGDMSDELCIIIDGQFQIIRHAEDGEQEVIGIAGRGDTIGEIGVISQSPREADVQAIRDSTVGRLTKEAYEKILQAYPLDISRTFIQTVINNLSQNIRHNKKPNETFALILDPAFKQKDLVVNNLIAGLREYGIARTISSSDIDIAFGRLGVAQATFEDVLNHSLLQWLSEQEIANRYVLYILDSELTQWTKRCLRQADHILFLLSSQQSPQIAEYEQAILSEIKNPGLKKTLVLIHPDSTQVPLQTSNWLDLRSVDMHHHVRENNPDDYRKVARFLTGNAVSLVLGGGGARGYAHLGVLRALKELNVAIDLIGGNSMGAVIAALYAMQIDFESALNMTRELCLAGDRMTLPITSVFSGEKMTEGLHRMLGDVCIEDLWLNFFSISCNISRAKVMTHDSGSLLTAVLNSNTPPGLFPPQIMQGDCLVDGALLNNVPVDVMAEKNSGGTIIAVDVNAREDLLDNTDNMGGISGWKLLWQKINPTIPRSKMPGMVEILTRASMIGGLAQRKKLMSGIADLYLQPPVNQFSLMAHKEARLIEQVGYEYALSALREWQATQLG
jgi:predicted acylesterase/phospholipase RssA/CRP-like cAMP-binding protein